MPCVKIKQLEERVATAGLHMGGGPERRKLEPGEILDISKDVKTSAGDSLFDVLWNTGKLEMVPDKPTRPLDYEDYREATLCSPTFNPRGPDEEIERDHALAAVAERMAVNEPKPDKKSKQAAKKTAKDMPSAPGGGRAARRAALKAAQNEQVVT